MTGSGPSGSPAQGPGLQTCPPGLLLLATGNAVHPNGPDLARATPRPRGPDRPFSRLTVSVLLTWPDPGSQPHLSALSPRLGTSTAL